MAISILQAASKVGTIFGLPVSRNPWTSTMCGLATMNTQYITPSNLPASMSNCAPWVILQPSNSGDSQSLAGDAVVPLTILQSCSSYLTKIWSATTQTFTVTLNGSAWETRTQTVPGSTVPWRSNFTRTVTNEVPYAAVTADEASSTCADSSCNNILSSIRFVGSRPDL